MASESILIFFTYMLKNDDIIKSSLSSQETMTSMAIGVTQNVCEVLI